jgi:hypothetical protein
MLTADRFFSHEVRGLPQPLSPITDPFSRSALTIRSV